MTTPRAVPALNRTRPTNTGRLARLTAASGIVAVAATGCVVDLSRETSDERAEASEAAILGGSSTNAFDARIVKIGRSGGTGPQACTGAILSREWVLTSRDCVGSGIGLTARQGDDSIPYAVGAIHHHPTVAVSLLHVPGAGFWASSSVGPHVLYHATTAGLHPTGASSQSVYRALDCFGFGDTYATPRTGRFVVESVDTSANTFDMSSSFASLAVGDLGGPCLRNLDGRLAGVIRIVTDPATGQSRRSTIAAASFREWVYAQMGVALRVRNQNSNLCLDVENGSLSNGAAISQYTCHTGANQKWYREPLPGGASGETRLRSALSGKCAERTLGDNRLRQQPCRTATDPDRGRQAFVGTEAGELRQGPGLCIDVPSGSLNPTYLQLYACHGGSNQVWYFDIREP